MSPLLLPANTEESQPNMIQAREIGNIKQCTEKRGGGEAGGWGGTRGERPRFKSPSTIWNES